MIARSSVVPYKSTPRPVNQVGAELGVASVLEGSVRKAGNHLRISLTLVDVETQEPTWSQTFDRELVDVFALQSEVAERTADALKLELARPHASGATHRPTPDLVAYDLYLRALVAANEDDGRGLDHAARCFEKATELDPHFAEAFAAWAQAYVAAAGEFLPMREVIPRARQLAERAMELDPELSDAHTAIASIAFQYDHDWGRAETEFREAIRLNPSNVTAHRFFALMLLALNRFDEARELLETALRLDPGGTHRETLALVDLTSGRFGAALAHMESERSRRPSAVGPHIYLGMFYVAAGRRPDALREADTPIAGATDSERFDHALLNALLGRPEAAREVAAKVERGEAESYTSATHLAILYAALGEKERALELLEKDFEEGDRVLWLYYRGVWFDSLRDDPRFLALLRRYDLPVGDIVEAPSTLRTRVARVRRRARVGRTPAGRTVPRAEIRRRPRTRGRTRGGSPRPRRAG